jgi:hypothetical protein
MKPASWYGVEFSSLLASEPASHVFESAAEVLAFASQRLLPGSSILIERIENGADHGNLIVYVNGTGRAFVRALEHRGFYATQASGPANEVAFIDEFGREFRVPGNQTIPADLAMETLGHWLPNQERLPGIAWGEE